MAIVDLDEMERLEAADMPVPWLKVLREALRLRQQLAAAEARAADAEADAKKLHSIALELGMPATPENAEILRRVAEAADWVYRNAPAVSLGELGDALAALDAAQMRGSANDDGCGMGSCICEVSDGQKMA